MKSREEYIVFGFDSTPVDGEMLGGSKCTVEAERDMYS